MPWLLLMLSVYHLFCHLYSKIYLCKSLPMPQFWILVFQLFSTPVTLDFTFAIHLFYSVNTSGCNNYYFSFFVPLHVCIQTFSNSPQRHQCPSSRYDVWRDVKEYAFSVYRDCRVTDLHGNNNIVFDSSDFFGITVPCDFRAQFFKISCAWEP